MQISSIIFYNIFRKIKYPEKENRRASLDTVWPVMEDIFWHSLSFE